MDIIIETDKLNFDTTTNRKLIVCNPCHYDDPISIACIKCIKQIVENQFSINVSIRKFKWDIKLVDNKLNK